MRSANSISPCSNFWACDSSLKTCYPSLIDTMQTPASFTDIEGLNQIMISHMNNQPNGQQFAMCKDQCSTAQSTLSGVRFNCAPDQPGLILQERDGKYGSYFTALGSCGVNLPDNRRTNLTDIPWRYQNTEPYSWQTSDKFAIKDYPKSDPVLPNQWNQIVNRVFPDKKINNWPGSLQNVVY